MVTTSSQQMTPISDESQHSQTNSNDNNNTSSTTNPTTTTKRKPSRRANTAERRATHNAVERARRETLNSRFLDLAALLPNLSQIRRPSKSAIVNSSIAHVHASRRHRLSAARELRSLKQEADALRRELNEWRDRAALPRIEEPQRGEGFSMVLSGELEVITISPDEDDEDAEGLYENVPADNQQPFYHEPEAPSAAMFAPHQAPLTPPSSSHGRPQQQQQQQVQQQQVQQQQQHSAVGIHPSMMPRGQMANMHPMVVSPQQVHFDPAHPSNMHGMPQFSTSPHAGHLNVHFAHHQEQSSMLPHEQEKAWSMGFAAAQRSMQNLSASNASPNAPFPANWHDISEDGSSDASGRARSGSLSTNGFGSPPRSPGSFDMGAAYDGQNYDLTSSASGADYGLPRALTVNTGIVGGPQMTSPIAIPGGGGFGNVMMGMM